LRIGHANVLDLRANWKTRQLRLFGYLRNAMDSFYLNSKAGFTDILATAGDPREIGIGLEASF